jgi:hypothetical protein
MPDFPRVIRSSVDGRYYKAAFNPEENKASKDWSAGVVMPDDIADIQAVTILDEVLGLARPQYNLRPLCRPIPMDQLTARIDVATALTGQRKVPPMIEAEISKQAYTAVNFDLWKNVVHVAASDEAAMKAAHAILALHSSDAARDLARMENLDIAEVAEANITEKVSGTAYSDWGAVTSGVSDTNPMLAIQASMDYIAGKGYPPDFVAMNPTIWGKFIQNTYIRDLVHSGIMSLASTGGKFTLPGYPTVELFTDWSLTATPTSAIGPIVGSRAAPALVLGEGPTMAAKYRNEKAGYDAYIIRQWLEPKVVLDDAADMICT